MTTNGRDDVFEQNGDGVGGSLLTIMKASVSVLLFLAPNVR